MSQKKHKPSEGKTHKNGHSNGSNGKGAASLRSGSGVEPALGVANEGYGVPGEDAFATQSIQPASAANGKTDASNGHSNGSNGSNGTAAATAKGLVRPVKVRLSAGAVKDLSTSHLTTYLSNGYTEVLSGNGHVDERATGVLSDTDLLGLRLRLKREEWSPVGRGSRRAHRRDLPPFMMRHRAMRSRSRVGYTRALVARRRYGNGGPAAAIGKVVVVLLFLATLSAFAGMGGAVAGGMWYINSQLPAVSEIHGISVQTTKIYDRKGRELFDIVDEGSGRRHEVKLNEISPLVISATLAAEDSSFYSNIGVDPIAIARAFKINLGGEGSSGASTITQQLVRQVNLEKEEAYDRTVSRKIKEMVQAVRFTAAYSKDSILEMFLNENYYGHRAYGIDAAALTYFSKPSKELTLAEAAMLAGLPQAPSDYDPFVNDDLAKRRQHIVLDLMLKQGMITQEQADAAKTETITQDTAQLGQPKTLVLRTYNPQIKAPHFVYYVKAYLEQLYGPEANTAGLVVTTTIDLDVQEAAEKVAKDRIDELKRQKATNASIVIMKPGTGEILGMVGSVDYYNKAIDGQVNVAIRERQPGSSFKPITYATAFKKGWTPGTTVLDVLTSFPNGDLPPYVPKNYDGGDHGWVTVRDALGNSYNIPAVKAIQFAGIEETIDTAHDLGIKGLNRGLGWYGLSLTLGGGEVTLLDMSNAYSTFANGGVEVDANPILKIEDPQGRIINCNAAYVTQSGKCASAPQKEFAAGKGQVLDPRHAYMITSILSDNRARSSAFGSNSPLRLSFPAGVKTGTTDDNRDSWTLGYTPDLTVGVWVGNSNNAQMQKVTGAIGAAVIWRNMMEAFYKNADFVNLLRDQDGKLQKDFVQPPGVVKDSACSAKGEVYDLFLKDDLPKGCVTYKDKNKQLHEAPSNKPKETPTPGARPTPMPGIWPPLQP